ncbi:ABC-2 type transport system ATP-binding protein [Dokdonella fugitiva]|uniref:ABC-2 type transport system ATP-binding protein n=1 Tax=Dokdonella fugitiva TaxID=328517 RepID=A0A839EYA1_9GAMM|nr:ATP-binding cassette domain-containing protein [Dokdonella fugitiva]MBA8886659.1 ABC-2 type transport system ATP-binding protein [Dokdonella fugitiva]
MSCLQTRQLVHRYRDDLVLDGIDLDVPAGSIYGFLGPNGAGKTTTLRLLLGLLACEGGEIRVFGRRLQDDRRGLLRRIGSMIETPSFYEHLTARENLLLLQRIHRCPKARIDEVLELVGLAGTGRKRAGMFSLGMKQRLGIAIALLHGPELLILDEPTNGLDPNGIVEMRALLRHLNRERAMTLLVSSHLLAEVERLVTHVGILHRGRLLFQGPIDALRARQCATRLLVLRTDDDVAAQARLAQAGHVARIEERRLVLPALDDAGVVAIVRDLVGAGIGVREVGGSRDDLESLFLDMVDPAIAREAA